MCGTIEQSAQQYGCQRSDQIHKKQIPFTKGYLKAVRALDSTWYNLHEQSTQEHKYFANTIINEETGRSLEYQDLIEHPKYIKDWQTSVAY